MTRTLASSLLVLLAVFIELAGPAEAQLTATAEVRTGCTSPGPVNSLCARPLLPLTFVPDERDVITMEVESVGPNGSWVLETDDADYRGDGYLRWDGPDLFQQPGVGTLFFHFRVDTTQRYLIRLRNRHDHPDPTSENDCWFRLNGGPWEKLVDSWGAAGVGSWGFNAFFESTGAFPEYELEAGDHLVEIAGRSAGFKIDSLHVVPIPVWFAKADDPESEVERDRPTVGATFSFEVGDPSDGRGFTPGATLAVPFLAPAGANAACGSSIPGVGELLLSPELGSYVLPARAWPGPRTPATFEETIPWSPSLIGVELTLQAVLLDAGQAALTDALDLLLGDA